MIQIQKERDTFVSIPYKTVTNFVSHLTLSIAWSIDRYLSVVGVRYQRISFGWLLAGDDKNDKIIIALLAIIYRYRNSWSICFVKLNKWINFARLTTIGLGWFSEHIVSSTWKTSGASEAIGIIFFRIQIDLRWC